MSPFPITINTCWARVRATFTLRSSFRKPTFELEFERTVEIIMIAFYWPWKESTVFMRTRELRVDKVISLVWVEGGGEG